MKHKTSTLFQFAFPLTQKVVRNLRIVTEHIGDLTVEGTGYRYASSEGWKYDVDIDFVKWNGADIKPILDARDNDLMEEIHEAACAHVSGLFQEKEVAA